MSTPPGIVAALPSAAQSYTAARSLLRAALLTGLLQATLVVAGCEGPTPAGSPAPDTGPVAEDTVGGDAAADTDDPGPVDTKMFEDSQLDSAVADAATADSVADAQVGADAVADGSDDVAAADASPVDAVATDAADAAATCPSGSFKPDKAGACQEATCSNMSKAVQAALAGAQAQLEVGCASDDQCTVVQTSTACSGTCGVAVLKSAAAEMAGVVTWVDDNICKPQSYGAKCGYATPGCIAPSVGCVAGKCVYSKPTAGACNPPQPANTVCEGTLWVCQPGFFKAYSGGDCLAATCDNLAKAKNEAVGGAVAQAQKCTVGEECIVVPTSTDCGGTCGAAVSAGMQNDVLKIVGWVDDNLCKKYDFKAKCGYSTPKCMAPKPTCTAGTCWYNEAVP